MVWGLGCLRAGDKLRCEVPERVASHPLPDQQSTNNTCQDCEHCWICLETAKTAPLIKPCACPRFVHEKCIARWQLQSAGKREESQCRFCGQSLPDWKKNMTPANVTPCRTAVMAVVLNGQEHRITVEPGPKGRSQFEAEIRRLFGLSQDDELEFTFDCQAPGEDVGRAENLLLEGKNAFEAAFHCAAVTAALRAQQKSRAT